MNFHTYQLLSKAFCKDNSTLTFSITLFQSANSNPVKELPVTKTQPYIVDMQCESIDKSLFIEDCHVTGCAIASSAEEALLMIQGHLVSRRYIIASVVAVAPKRDLQHCDYTEEQLLNKALQSSDLCSLMSFSVHEVENSKEHNTQQH